MRDHTDFSGFPERGCINEATRGFSHLCVPMCVSQLEHMDQSIPPWLLWGQVIFSFDFKKRRNNRFIFLMMSEEVNNIFIRLYLKNVKMRKCSKRVLFFK